MLKIKLNIERKYKFIIQSVFLGFVLMAIAFGRLNVSTLNSLLIMSLIGLVGMLIVHYPNIDFKNVYYTMLMPVCLVFGAILFFHLFPNFGTTFRVVVVLSFAFFHYLISLIDNIFLVVHEREELIPLYRVATAWSQILQVLVAIPIFSGIFKLNTGNIFQNIIISFISFLFVLYQIWVSRYDKDAKNAGVGEKLFLASMVFFMVFAVSTAFSFIPSEAFLKSILVSIVLMFGLSYVASHLRNEINKKFIFQFLFIFCLFFVIVTVFTP